MSMDLVVRELMTRRRLMKMTQQKLAMTMGVRQSVISGIENGADLRLSTLRKLCSALGCDLVVVPIGRTDAAESMDIIADLYAFAEDLGLRVQALHEKQIDAKR